jgi:hypothetical protein
MAKEPPKDTEPPSGETSKPTRRAAAAEDETRAARAADARSAEAKSADARAADAPTAQPRTVDACPVGCEIGPLTGATRADEAKDRRDDATNAQRARPLPAHDCNNDEVTYGPASATFPNRFLGNFTKGLFHTNDYQVDHPAYCHLLRSLNTGTETLPPPPGPLQPPLSAIGPPPSFNANPGDDFETIRLGCVDADGDPVPDARKLENPQAAFAFELEGADSHSLRMPPAPAFSSRREAAEIAENYWMALARDVPFTEYADNTLIEAAADDLSNFGTDYEGPTSARHLFRGSTPGERIGPYVSQLLLLDVPFGSRVISGRIRTVQPRVDYLTDYGEWLRVQNGCDANQSNCDPVFRFIRNGRDLGQFVHVDRDFDAFLNACLLLISGRDPLRRCEAAAGLGVPFARCLPYVNPSAPAVEEFPGKSRTQIGLGTFGDQYMKSLLVGVTYRAFHAVWYQKWSVHRRLRPEEFGGWVHLRRLQDKGVLPGPLYPIHPDLFHSELFDDNSRYSVFAHNRRQNCNRRRNPANDTVTDPLGQPLNGGTYLLPVAYAEGSPLHPAYGSGHATVAGACGTLLKAFFNEDQCLPNPMVPTRDGLALVPYRGRDRNRITVGGEINKLVSNISLGRNFAGVHWRTDYTNAIRLGEEVAINLLCDQRNLYNEPYEFRFTRFDGTGIRIRPGAGACPEAADPDGACERTQAP